MPFQDNSALITTANLLTIANNNQVDTIQNPAGATAFSFTSGMSGDDTIRDFITIDTLLNYKKIFDGNGDNIIDIGSSSVLDIDRTSSTHAGPDQITLEGLANGGLRYLGSKQGYYVYADAKGGLSGFVEGTVGNNSFDASSTDRSYFYDTALGLNLGGDTITGFGADDRIVTTTAFYKGGDPRIEVTTGANAVFDLSGVAVNVSDDSGATHGGQIDIVGVNTLYLQGTSIANGVTYYSYGTVQQVLNTPPTAPATKQVTTLEDTASVAVAIGATDADSDALSYAIKSGEGPGKGSVSFDPVAGTFVYTPNANANGADAFTVLISDGFGGVIEQRVTATVTPVQDQIATVSLATVGAGIGGLKIVGQAADDRAGYSVSGAGDVNGDGLADFVVGAWGSNSVGTDSGAAYVVFGRTGNDLIDLNAVANGLGGFKIKGEASMDGAGFSVSAGGDLNGDGLADLLIGAHGADSETRYYNGATYAVYGKATGSTVELRNVASGVGGFKILGATAGGLSGYSVSNVGDLNGDGFQDIIVGSPGHNANGADTGSAHIIFGKANHSLIDLSDISSENLGLELIGPTVGGKAGYSVSKAGDVNGDGIEDVVIGAHLNITSDNRPGTTYVLFGQSTTGSFSLAQVGSDLAGFQIVGEKHGSYAGFAVSSAGDVNGDGLSDLIIGAPYYANPGFHPNGAAYVVFGKTDETTVDLEDVAAGIGGFKIVGENPRDYAGRSVSSAGDINGDGLADLIIGSTTAFTNDGSTSTGAAYVIFGKKNGNLVDLDNIAAGIGGFKFQGDAYNSATGQSVAGVGDVNGDGFADLLVGAPLHNSGSLLRNGTAYLIYGSADWLI